MTPILCQMRHLRLLLLLSYLDLAVVNGQGTTNATSPPGDGGDGGGGAGQVDFSCDFLNDVNCPTLENGICESELAENPLSINPDCTRGDCIDCGYFCENLKFDCVGCFTQGCYWCPGDGTCWNTDQLSFAGDIVVQSCTSPEDYFHKNMFGETTTPDDICDGSSTTGISNKPFNDPLYTVNQWMYDMIQIEQVWNTFQLFGNGIRVRINDSGTNIATNGVEIPLERFDLQSSCDDFEARDDHGTIVASIVGGQGNNSFCGVGIAPLVTLSACYALESPEFIDYKIDAHDISQSSIGNAGCELPPLSNDGENPGNTTKTSSSSSNSIVKEARYTKSQREKQMRRRLRKQQQEEAGLEDNDEREDEETSSRHRYRRLQDCPFTHDNVFDTVFPCTICDFTTTPLSSECEAAIVEHCTNYFENDESGCLDHLSILVGEDGECQYNTLSIEAQDRFINGITNGREGKGIIYVFASGNEYIVGDDVNFQGILNSRFTISVGSVDKSGKHASYSTPGSALFITAPGGDFESITNFAAVDATGTCVDPGQGTSFATPIVSGVIALLLETNPNLTWRDVQGILATTSTLVTDDPNDTTRTTNGASITHSNLYGFGIVNALNAVTAAQPSTWTLYPPEQMLSGESGLVNLVIADSGSSSSPVAVVSSNIDIANNATTAPGQDDTFYTESVVVLLDLRHFSRGDLNLILTSPMGTSSILHPGKRPENTQLDVDERWKLMTVKNWGESPYGTWTLSIEDLKPGDVLPCSDHLWHIDIGDNRLTCLDFDNAGFCVNGAVDLEALGTNAFILEVTDEEQNGLTAEEACCECGGGRTREDEDPSSTPDELVQWRLVVYGHSTKTQQDQEPSIPPSLQPSISGGNNTAATGSPSPSSPSNSTSAQPTSQVMNTSSPMPSIAPSSIVQEGTTSSNPTTTPLNDTSSSQSPTFSTTTPSLAQSQLTSSPSSINSTTDIPASTAIPTVAVTTASSTTAMPTSTNETAWPTNNATTTPVPTITSMPQAPQRPVPPPRWRHPPSLTMTNTEEPQPIPTSEPELDDSIQQPPGYDRPIPPPRWRHPPSLTMPITTDDTEATNIPDISSLLTPHPPAPPQQQQDQQPPVIQRQPIPAPPWWYARNKPSRRPPPLSSPSPPRYPPTPSPMTQNQQQQQQQQPQPRRWKGNHSTHQKQHHHHQQQQQRWWWNG